MRSFRKRNAAFAVKDTETFFCVLIQEGDSWDDVDPEDVMFETTPLDLAFVLKGMDPYNLEHLYFTDSRKKAIDFVVSVLGEPPRRASTRKCCASTRRRRRRR